MTAIAAPSLPAGYIRPVLVAGISFYGPTYAGPKRERRVTLSSSGIGNGPTGVRQELRALRLPRGTILASEHAAGTSSSVVAALRPRSSAGIGRHLLQMGSAQRYCLKRGVDA